MGVVRRLVAGLVALLVSAASLGLLESSAASPTKASAAAQPGHGLRPCQRFALTDLGVLGGEDSRAYAVSSNGFVAGLGDSSPGSGSRGFHAFRWTPYHPFAVSGSIADLGTLGTDDRSGAFGINRSGLTVGVSLSSEGGSVAFVVDRRMRALPGLGDQSGAEDVDDRGRIAGYARAADGTNHAVLWVRHHERFRLVDLGVPRGRIGSSATALSSFGHVAGDVSDPDYYGFAALWTPRRPHATVGTWRELGVLRGGSGSAARDVNRFGVVVGEGDSVEGDRGWVFDPRRDTRLRVLRTLPGGWASHAFAVNDHGLVSATPTSATAPGIVR